MNCYMNNILRKPADILIFYENFDFDFVATLKVLAYDQKNVIK